MPCRYGAKCYQKNALHHEKFKHPPAKDANKQKATKRTAAGKKRKKIDDGRKANDSPKRKVQKVDEDETEETSAIPGAIDNETSEIAEGTSNPENTEDAKESADRVTLASLLEDCDVDAESDKLLPSEARAVISHFLLTDMPRDFFDFYEFCKSVSEEDPLDALKSLQLRLVGPYDVFRDKFLSSKVEDKKALLRHWRYYYDPPEFQTIIRVDGKDGSHFGYWRDDPSEKPAFVAINKANVNCTIERAAENIFGAIDAYIGGKVKLANPFEKTRIAKLQQKLKSYAKEKQITLEKKTSDMEAREKKVVARTFHGAGIVAPYNKTTELGYRELIVTDSELQKLLKQIEKAPTSEEKKAPMSKLEEVIRLATIAADECDFGTCLELGHDLFSSGVPAVQNKALNMLSLAYNLLQRPQFLQIIQTHLQDRKKGSSLSVLR